MDSVLKHRTEEPRLNSWKEIAAFFDCTERTVRRWEQERGLPIHRLPGKSGGKVYAYRHELKQWLEAPGSAQPLGPELVEDHADAESEASNSFDEVETSPETSAGNTHPRRSKLWLIIAALSIALLVGGAYLRDRIVRQSAETAKLTAGKSLHHPTPEAEDLYLKGRYYWNLRTPAGLTSAVDNFTQAIVRDPQYAQAYGGLADCYNLMREYTLMPSNEAYPRALAAAQKAVELDDSLADAHASMGFVLFYWKWDAAAAEHEFRRAIELDPNNVKAHQWYATVLSTQRRNPEGLAQIEIARKLAPDSKSILADKGTLLSLAGRNDEAAALLKQMEAAEPDFVSPHRYLIGIYFSRGEYHEYLAESRKVAQLMHDDSALALTNVAEAGFQKSGYQGMLEALLDAQKKYFDQGKLPAYTLAETYGMLRQNEAALHYLQLAHDRHDEGFPYIYLDGGLDNLRPDSRYQKLVHSIFPAAQF